MIPRNEAASDGLPDGAQTRGSWPVNEFGTIYQWLQVSRQLDTQVLKLRILVPFIPEGLKLVAGG